MNENSSLPETRAARSPISLADALAVHFRSRPNVWVDGRELAVIGGYAAWRTRTSELRHPPYNMDIENRQRRVKTAGGHSVTVSEYRWRPTGGASTEPSGLPF